MSHHPSYAMAGLCAIGGIMGLIKGRSFVSLVAGMGIGSIYWFAGRRIEKNQTMGHDIALSASTLLLFFMAPKALRTRAPVPIIMTTLGTASTAYEAKKSYEEVYGV
ncbi:hypothetical protein GGH12_002672 [Coemansia sp. RSA 1822]|nr:hypothetical protein LPJ58_003182 [Coemansia sp. RSA 1591]KAJ1761228.1 hypothetical protein LPJ69_003145 [Coemansia sp. RSA 1752]KAJ1778540.1 hypothetical protein LPJ54_001624 [Coemansia sp. RSA 1824]KAJ1786942.1 hypothetical protein LPJ62_003591 [Coemansia sp. RSA 2167]KAJ1787872.1 hypothetical protein LPJ67_003045 [Coemansia sp. RSA 1938]KAJ1809168.1 hypothetical protein LPJ77_001843 [Coemansia sp. RSA 2523]KAJ1856192.1 hypothetical protein LPJ76_002686 [Coemansia sp. RSA 638]KAJ2125192